MSGSERSAIALMVALLVALGGAMILAAAGENRVCKGEMIKRDGYVMCRETW